MWWKDYGLRLRALLFRRRMDEELEVDYAGHDGAVYKEKRRPVAPFANRRAITRRESSRRPSSRRRQWSASP